MNIGHGFLVLLPTIFCVIHEGVVPRLRKWYVAHKNLQFVLFLKWFNNGIT